MPPRLSSPISVKKPLTILTWFFIIVATIMLVLALVFAIVALVRYINNQHTKQKEECPKGFVCTPKTHQSQQIQQIQQVQQTHYQKRDPLEQTSMRDKRVLEDQLYPPLNRTDALTFDSVVRESRNRNINVPTNNTWDSYRLVGYIKSKQVDQEYRQPLKDAGGNSWKLMARQKDRNESDFYLVPTNNNYDIKVPLTPDVFVGQRFKDVYTIPKEVQFKSPMLNTEPYEFVELPKTDFIDPRYV